MDLRNSLLGPVTRIDNWDLNRYTPDVALTLNIKAFFENPVSDWKKMSPPYAVSLDTVAYQQDNNYSFSAPKVRVTAPESGFFSGDCEIRYSDFELDPPVCTGPAWLTAPLQALVGAEIAPILLVPGWSGDASVNARASKVFSAGTDSVTVSLNINYGTATRWVTILILTFDADSFEEWEADFPDPRINGLFPTAISADQILQVFDVEPHEWRKVLRINWLVSFDFPVGPPPLPPVPSVRRRS